MTQWGTIVIIDYIIGILPLICDIRAAHSHITQLWYTDEAGAGGKFATLQEHMQDTMVRGPTHGYLPEPIKRILVISPRNVLRMEE